MKQVFLRVDENIRIADRTYRMRLSGDVSAFTAPGQFLNLKLDGFTLRRVWRGATYEIVVENPDHLEKGVKAMTVDGKPVSGNILSPVPAGSTVEVKIVMG